MRSASDSFLLLLYHEVSVKMLQYQYMIAVKICDIYWGWNRRYIIIPQDSEVYLGMSFMSERIIVTLRLRN